MTDVNRAQPSKRLETALDALLLVFVFIVSNRASWLCIFEVNKLLFSCEYGHPTDELLLYAMATGVVLWLLRQRAQLTVFWTLWRRNWILGAFIALSFASTIWSIGPNITLFKSLLIASSALVASYLGYRYLAKEWILFVACFGMVVIVLSFVLVAVLPGTAIMSSPGLVGNWRGAFSHKNYMGSIVAYCSAALLYVLLTARGRLAHTIVFGACYVLSIVLLILSRSATGIVLFCLLNAFTLGLFAFSRWRHHLTPVHYWFLAAIAFVASLNAAVNSSRILGLLGRESSLTGRIPFWSALIRTATAGHLWLGYGTGTVWFDPAFRARIDADLKGTFPIINAHSGYLETFLSLGLAGSLLLLLLICLIAYRISHSPSGDLNLIYWEAMTLLYVLITNVTTSFLFEFETFHWVLLVAVLFMATRWERPTFEGP